MEAIILCGGMATRLGEITRETPKALLRIGEATILEHQIQMLKDAGIRRVILATGHLNHAIESAVGHSLLGVELIHAYETERLGTGGAIQHALSYVHEFPVVVLNGDVLFGKNIFVDALSGPPETADAVIIGVLREDTHQFGLIEFDPATKKVHAFLEKDPTRNAPGYINAGVYILRPSFVDYFPSVKQFSVEYDVFPRVAHLFTHPVSIEWMDVGTPESLEAARRWFASL